MKNTSRADKLLGNSTVQDQLLKRHACQGQHDWVVVKIRCIWTLDCLLSRVIVGAFQCYKDKLSHFLDHSNMTCFMDGPCEAFIRDNFRTMMIFKVVDIEIDNATENLFTCNCYAHSFYSTVSMAKTRRTKVKSTFITIVSGQTRCGIGKSLCSTCIAHSNLQLRYVIADWRLVFCNQSWIRLLAVNRS